MTHLERQRAAEAEIRGQEDEAFSRGFNEHKAQVEELEGRKRDIARQAILNADQFGVGRITAIKEAFELNDIKVDFAEAARLAWALKDI